MEGMSRTGWPRAKCHKERLRPHPSDAGPRVSLRHRSAKERLNVQASRTGDDACSATREGEGSVLRSTITCVMGVA